MGVSIILFVSRGLDENLWYFQPNESLNLFTKILAGFFIIKHDCVNKL